MPTDKELWGPAWKKEYSHDHGMGKQANVKHNPVLIFIVLLLPRACPVFGLAFTVLKRNPDSSNHA